MVNTLSSDNGVTTIGTDLDVCYALSSRIVVSWGAGAKIYSDYVGSTVLTKYLIQ